MTPNEKARAYDEALEKARKYHAAAKSINDPSAARYENIFPELRESEDERTRKELVEKISNLACGCFISQEQKQKFITYLEKQKEPHKRLRDKTPWIVTAKEELAHDEERLQANLEELHRIRAEKENQKEQKPEYPLTPDECIKPAEWSEEDEKDNLDILLSMIDVSDLVPYSGGHLKLSDEKKKELKTFIKLFPEKFNISPKQEWSEEDRLHYVNVLEALEYVKGCKSDYDKIEAVKSDIAWLKDFHPFWKPTDEQMTALKHVAYGAHQNGDGPALRELYNQLVNYKRNL